MTPDVLTFPIDPNPCQALSCNDALQPVTECWRRSCAYTWARMAREDRQRREEHDAKARAEG